MAQYNGPNANFTNTNVWQNLSCDGGIKAVPLELDWSVQDEFVVNLLFAQQQDFLPGLGTIWFNNARTTNSAGSAAAANVQLIVDGSTQDMTLRREREGYFPIIAPTPARLTFTGQANAAKTQVILLSALLPGVITLAS